MRLSVNLAALQGVQWHQYALRFALGGLVTVAAGLIARAAGPTFGGLFLAFPAIFPASATLIAQRERRKKAHSGLDGARRGRRAAALDAAGTVIGAVGLACFAAAVWREAARGPAIVVLCASALLWLVISVSLWRLRKSWQRHRPRRVTKPN